MSERLLLVSATLFEVGPTLHQFGAHHSELSGIGVAGGVLQYPTFDCLITGVGQLQCAVHLMSQLTKRDYVGVVQAGLAGSFSPNYPKCAVVCAAEEILGDCGAEADGSFLDIGDMGLLPRGEFPFVDGVLRAPDSQLLRRLRVPRVRSITVNRTLAHSQSIDWVKKRFRPDIVNMEGAALFYVCLLRGIPFVELRAISDMVGPRNKAEWDIQGAVTVLNAHVADVLKAV